MKANETPAPDRTACSVCPRHCLLKEGQTGACGIRIMSGGMSISTVYGRVAAVAIDPVEKKPLYHVQPGSSTWSLALPGCSMHCSFCQNHRLSQVKADTPVSGSPWSDQDFLDGLKASGCGSVSFTYSEPLVWHEWVSNMALLARKAGKKVLVVSNGWCSPQTLTPLAGLVDAWNIDLKGDEAFYHDICEASLEPVMQTIETLSQAWRNGAGGLVEVTTMVIQGLHTPAGIRDLGEMLKNAGVEIWHLSRFHPDWRMMARPASTEEYLEEMLSIARQTGLPFVYGGNSSHIQDTRCPGCSRVLVKRDASGRGRLAPEIQAQKPDTARPTLRYQSACPDCGRNFPLIR